VDTSKEYIEMHLALPQELKEQPCEGDYYFDSDDKEYKCQGRMGEVYFDLTKKIKLYEQDQLQEMIGDYLSCFEIIDRFICSDVENEKWEGIFDSTIIQYRDFRDYFHSMEQLWLAFVMKEKYNKVWNGSDWI